MGLLFRSEVLDLDNRMKANLVPVGNSMTVLLGDFQKNVVIPTFLVIMKVAQVGYAEKWLAIEFRKRDGEEVKAS
jgi:arsenite-transporting ATPase